MYINTETKEFPVYEGDIRLAYPRMGAFVLPDIYAEVETEEAPVVELPYYTHRLAPVFENNRWVCKWEVYKIPDEHMEEVRHQLKLQDAAFYHKTMAEEDERLQALRNQNLNNAGEPPNVIG